MFASKYESAPVLVNMAAQGSRGAHVLGIAFVIAKSRGLIGSDVTFEQYNNRRLKAEQEEAKL